MLICALATNGDKNIKKTIKILAVLIVSLLLLILGIYAAFQTKLVQNAIISSITKTISEKNEVQFTIKKVNIALFRKIVLSDVYLSDQHLDTLLYSRKITAKIDSFSIFKSIAYLGKITLEKPLINI